MYSLYISLSINLPIIFSIYHVIVLYMKGKLFTEENNLFLHNAIDFVLLFLFVFCLTCCKKQTKTVTSLSYERENNPHLELMVSSMCSLSGWCVCVCPRVDGWSFVSSLQVVRRDSLSMTSCPAWSCVRVKDKKREASLCRLNSSWPEQNCNTKKMSYRLSRTAGRAEIYQTRTTEEAGVPEV